MRPDLDRIRRAEGAGPWLHISRRPPEGRGRIRGFLAGLVIGALVAFAAFHVAPKAIGQVQHDLKEYGR